jgi:hypothetical protein
MSAIQLADAGARAQALRDEGEMADAWTGGRLQPDFLLPVQYYELTRRRQYLDGEIRLAFAVLEDAIRTYVRGARPNAREWQVRELEEVRAWFDASSSDAPFSFCNICDALGIDAAFLRKRLDRVRPESLPQKQLRAVGRRHAVYAMKERRAGRSGLLRRRGRIAS